MASSRQQAINLTNNGLIYWCIYTSLGFDELSITYVPNLLYVKNCMEATYIENNS